jgi:hypothetical protein
MPKKEAVKREDRAETHRVNANFSRKIYADLQWIASETGSSSVAGALRYAISLTRHLLRAVADEKADVILHRDGSLSILDLKSRTAANRPPGDRNRYTLKAIKKDEIAA